MREVPVLTTMVIHCNVAVCTMTVIVWLAVMWSRSRSRMMHGRSIVMYSGPVHVSIV